MFSIFLPVKPTVSMPGDVTPDLSQDDDDTNEDQAPTGDLAVLAHNVGMQQLQQPVQQVMSSSSGARPKTKKNKGVGKGCSGSSGPPIRKCKNNLMQQPTEDSDDEEEVQVDEDAEPSSTQDITVGVRHGYSVYPGYLFDVPPKRIRVDHLRKQFMIHEIARAHAERRFYRHGMTFMSTIKEFLRMFAAQNGMQFPGNASNNEHAYAMTQNDSYEPSEEEGSDVEMADK